MDRRGGGERPGVVSTLSDSVRLSVKGKCPLPACTGKPLVGQLSEIRQTVYPRVYGETNGPRTRGWCSIGLSPRVRGNLVVGLVQVDGLGSIPACTGKPAQAA